MRLEHDCVIFRQEVPWGVARIRVGWTCPICGERWSIIHRRAGYDATRQRPLLRVIKHWLWTRDVKREMREDKLL